MLYFSLIDLLLTSLRVKYGIHDRLYRNVLIIKRKADNNKQIKHTLFYVIYFNITVAMYATICCGLHVARCDFCIQCTVFQCFVALVQCVGQCTLAACLPGLLCTHILYTITHCMCGWCRCVYIYD